MHLPHVVHTHAIAEGRHESTLAAVDDDLEELHVSQLGLEEVLGATAGPLMADDAFTAVDSPPVLDGGFVPQKGVHDLAARGFLRGDYGR